MDWRAILALASISCAMSCDLSERVLAVTELGIDRRYVAAACLGGSSLSSLPCLYTSTPSTQQWLDSGSVALSRDKSFVMALWFHSCFQSCPPTGTGSVLTATTGTYVLNHEYIELTDANGNRLVTVVTATLPDKAKRSWTGPDTVYFAQGYYQDLKTLFVAR
jgi:hypothetical protein